MAGAHPPSCGPQGKLINKHPQFCLFKNVYEIRKGVVAWLKIEINH